MNEETELPMLCGNLTGARHCPTGFTCLCIGNNPNHGYTNFDNFMWSMLTTFQLITLDYWENVYNMVSWSKADAASREIKHFPIILHIGPGNLRSNECQLFYNCRFLRFILFD